MRTPRDVAAALHDACDAAGLDYVIVGGVAVMAWGQPRATMDVDTLLRLEAAGIDAFVAELRARGLRASALDFRDSLLDGSHVTIHDDDSIFRVDVKLARTPTEYDEITDGVIVDLGEGANIRVASPEDTLAWKLKFGSPQDLQDARGIWFRQQGRLDLDRLRATCKRLGVAARLQDLEDET